MLKWALWTPLPTMQVTGSKHPTNHENVSTRLMLSGHDFLMATSAVENLDGDAALNLTVSIDSAKTVLVPAELYTSEMAEGYLAVNDKAAGEGEKCVAAVAAGIVAVMAVDERIVRLLGSNPLWRVTYTSPLLEGVVSYTRAVRVTLTADNTHIVVSDHGKLLYAEVFATTEPDNILFVMTKLCEIMSIANFETRVAGPEAQAVAAMLAEVMTDCKAV